MSDTSRAGWKTRSTVLLLCLAYSAPALFWFFLLDADFFGEKQESSVGGAFLVLAIGALAVGLLSLVSPSFLRVIRLSQFPPAELGSNSKPTFRQRNLDALSQTLFLTGFLTLVFGWICMTDECSVGVFTAILYISWWAVLPAVLGAYCAKDNVFAITVSLIVYGVTFLWALGRGIYDMCTNESHELTSAFGPWLYLILSFAVAGSAAIVLLIEKQNDRDVK